MRRLVILGGGTAGTMVADKLVHRLDGKQWRITVVDQDEAHVYQPGFLFMPFGAYRSDDVVKPRQRCLAGRPLPLPAHTSMAGKRRSVAREQ